MSSTELFIAIQQNKVRFFQKQEHYIPLTLDGMEEFPSSDLTQDIPGLLERFADKLNLNSLPSCLFLFSPANILTWPARWSSSSISIQPA